MNIDQQTIENIVVGAVQKHFAAAAHAARADDDDVTVLSDKTGSGDEDEIVSDEKTGSDEKTVSGEKIPAGVSLIDSVITAEILEQHTGGNRSFRIGKKSLLTPTAHDYIRAHGLSWSRAADETTRDGATWLAIVVTPTAQVSGTLGQFAENWRRELLSTVGEAVRMADAAISRAEAVGVAIITDNARLAACLGNRSPNIRAAAVANINDLDAAIEEIGANVVAVDPLRLGGFPLRQLLRRFHEAGSPQPPENWETLSRLW